MPEIEIQIGGRSFDVACQEGEESYLRAAAKLLDEEASVLSAQIGRIPEARLLLMAGLMLADKTAGIEDKLRRMEDRMAEKEAELDQLRNAPAPAPQTDRARQRQRGHGRDRRARRGAGRSGGRACVGQRRLMRNPRRCD